MSEEDRKEQEEQELGQEELENVSGGILIGLNQPAQKVKLGDVALGYVGSAPSSTIKMGQDIIKQTHKLP